MSDNVTRVSWRATPGARLAGAFASWLVFALSFTLLFQSALAVIGLGGFCASGGPYVIETECPPAVALFAPLSILGGFIAIGIALALAGGFGTPVTLLAWPILFCGLSVVFFAGFAAEPAAWSWLIIGVLFVAMGLGPLVLLLRTEPRAILLGSRTITGEPFAEPARREPPARWVPRRPPPEGTVEPRSRHWLLAVLPALVGGGLGVWLGVELFRAAGG